MAEGPSGQVRVLAAVDPAARRMTRLGIGLLVSLVIGFPAIAGALRGSAEFELAVIRFVVTVVASVGGVLALGWLHDSFVLANARARFEVQRQARAVAAVPLEGEP